MVSGPHIMNLAAALFVTASVLFAIGDCHGTYRRVKVLEKKVNQLTEDVDELKKDVAWLKELLLKQSEIKNVTETENTTVIEVETTETPTETINWVLGDPLRILEITRVVIGEGLVRYTVIYEVTGNGTSQDFDSVWQLEYEDGTRSRIRNGTTSKHYANDSQLMSDSVEVMSGPTPYVLYWLSVGNIRYTVALNNTEARDQNLTNPSLPYIYVDQPEVVYDPGSNASFQIFTSDQHEIYPPVKSAILYKPGTQDLVGRNQLKMIFTISSNETLSGKPGTLINITNDMEEHLSGVITVSVKKPFHDSFVQEVEIYKGVVVRPSSQPDPFEEDFFVFYNKDRITDEDGNILQTSRYGEPTNVVCTTVGSKVTTITLKESTRRGRRLKTVQGPSSVHSFLYAAVDVYQFSPKVSKTIVCEATNENGRTISQTTLIQVQLPAKVISGTAILTGSDSFLRQIRIRCTGKGDPLPKMYIAVNCGGTFLFFEDNELELVSKSATQKTITVTKDVLLPYGIPPKYVNVICQAKNEADVHQMSIPLKIR